MEKKITEEKKSILMQDIWQMMQHMKCGQKGQLAFLSC